jgi:integrase
VSAARVQASGRLDDPRHSFPISAPLAAAVRWEWIKSNPAAVARKPRKPAPEPQPPTPEQAAQIVDAAWQQDEDWGTFVWLTMVTGMRRAELLGLRWHHVHLDRAVLETRRNYVWVDGRAVEKDTKTHRMRRIALDPDTVELLAAHRQRFEDAVRGWADGRGAVYPPGGLGSPSGGPQGPVSARSPNSRRSTAPMFRPRYWGASLSSRRQS